MDGGGLRCPTPHQLATGLLGHSAEAVDLSPLDELPADLAQIRDEALRLCGSALAWRLQRSGAEAAIVFSIESETALSARRLTHALYTFCDQMGLGRRFLVVGTTPTHFRRGPDMPDGWPPEAREP